jgi:hypothetical protein
VTVSRREGRCPGCGYRTDAVGGVSDPDARPSPGDTSICMNCGHVAVFTETGLRVATMGELIEAMLDPDVRETVQRIHALGFIPGYRR